MVPDSLRVVCSSAGPAAALGSAGAKEGRRSGPPVLCRKRWRRQAGVQTELQVETRSRHVLRLLSHLCVTHLLCLRDEDDQLYEKLSGEQWRLECLMQLLAELKGSDLPGDFFLALLKVKVQVNLTITQRPGKVMCFKFDLG